MTDLRYKVQVWIFRFAGEVQDKAGLRSQVQQSSAAPALQVLILRTNAARGGFWQPVTGGVEPGEEISHAALREAREETGLFLEEPVLSLNTAFQFESRGKIFEEHCFAIRAPGAGLQAPHVTIDPKEHDAFQWVSSSEALALLRHESNASALRALQKILKSSNS